MRVKVVWTSEREAQLRDALAGLDTAYVGTIHSFADRLLRLRPVEAALSPSYEIAEDQEPLVRETLQVLLHTVERGTLAAELTGADASSRSDEATQTILDALAAGLQVESRETEWKIYYGLDALVEGFVRQRDIPPPDVAPISFDFTAFRLAADEFVHIAASVGGDSLGADWIVRTASFLMSLKGRDDPVAVYREVKHQLDRAPRDVTKRDTFAGDAAAWCVWKAFIGEDKQRPRALRDDLCAPLDRWMATRLVRLFPIVVTLYERVKVRRRQLDQLDLLLKLRDLLVTDRAVRGEFQQMFDHILVDEFQDRVLARYLRWLVEVSDIRIVDPLDGRPRRVRYSDIAILAVSTWRLSLLFPWPRTSLGPD